MVEFRSMDLHSYAKTCSNIRNDFKKLLNSKDENEVNSMLEKYEFYIENSYKVNAYTRKINYELNKFIIKKRIKYNKI